MKKWYWEAPNGKKGFAQEEAGGFFGFGSKLGIYEEGSIFGFGSRKIGEVDEVIEEVLRDFLEKKFGKPIKIWR